MSINSVETTIQQTLTSLTSDNNVKQALAHLINSNEHIIKQQIKLAETASPPFNEDKRRKLFIKLLTEAGLNNLTIDSEGNVYGYYHHVAGRPTLFLAAHLDSVFAIETDVTVTYKNNKYYGAGIYDDARGLAVVISIAAVLNKFNIELDASLMIGATVGEEGPGNLRGAKYFFKTHPEVDAFISVDIDAPNEVIYRATGSLRYIYTFNGSGGHSYSDFGRPSAVHAAARAITHIANLTPPTNPKTTFNVGVMNGGTIPTAIAEEAMIYVDMRSIDANALTLLHSQITNLVAQAVDEENEHWSMTDSPFAINVMSELKGDRPAGSQSDTAIPVLAAMNAARSLGLTPRLSEPASTDINAPLSIGVPAIAIGGGGKAYDEHSTNESFDPTDSHLGPQRVLLTVLTLLGIKGVTTATLTKR
ncbi:M20/M25/M40 family metallo-hydrolase [Brochothrix campestris]|uniref:M20/M25/M40 family metallo-hydrolase n=1 Tax=Brochothrix campestris TaxID=2757 RepID=UPI0038CFB1B9